MSPFKIIPSLGKSPSLLEFEDLKKFNAFLSKKYTLNLEKQESNYEIISAFQIISRKHLLKLEVLSIPISNRNMKGPATSNGRKLSKRNLSLALQGSRYL